MFIRYKLIIQAFRDNEIAEKLNFFSELYVSSIAVGELYYGAYLSANPKKHLAQVNQFVNNCILLSIDAVTADFYGSIKSVLKDKGKPIPDNDIWIAAVSAQFNIPLLTMDNHFKEIASITLANLNK